MFAIYNCIANAHDLRLVGLAAVICSLASFTAICLLHHMRRSSGRWRLMWLAVSAISTGFGIWATHFIAMLAFTPGVPSAYDIVLTFLSLIAAIFLTGAGLAAAVMPRAAIGTYLGGAMSAAASQQCIIPGWRLSRFRRGSSVRQQAVCGHFRAFRHAVDFLSVLASFCLP